MKTTTRNKAMMMLEPFRRFYVDMYEGKIEDSPSWLVDRGDKLIKKNKELCSAFVELRKDFISSDREAAAFAMAYDYIYNTAGLSTADKFNIYSAFETDNFDEYNRLYKQAGNISIDDFFDFICEHTDMSKYIDAYKSFEGNKDGFWLAYTIPQQTGNLKP